MPEEPPAGTTPVDSKPLVTPTPPDDGDDDLKALPDDWKKKVKDLRLENSRRRDDAKTAKEEAKTAKEEAAALKKAKADEETEKQKKNGEWEAIANQKDEALKKANERTMRSELKLFAQQNGILDPSDVNNLSLDGITIDDAGEVHGAEKAIKKLKGDKPHWFKSDTPATPPAPKPTSSGAEPPPGTASAKGLSELSPKEYEERKREFMAGVKKRA